MPLLTICGTGHRPGKLGPDGYSNETFDRLIQTAGAWLDHNAVAAVISGMALGWDQALAVAAIERGIPVHAYLPFRGQADQWPTEANYRYSAILSKCASIKIVCEGGYSKIKMQLRNEAMVDAADFVLALWDGSPGGTGNCVAYAMMEGKRVENLWDLFSM